MAYGVVASHLRRHSSQIYHSQIHYDGPLTIDSHLTEATLFSYVDFLPFLRHLSTDSSTAFQGAAASAPFRSILANANEWLARHIEYEVMCCESIMLPFERDDRGKETKHTLSPCKTYFSLLLTENEHYVRALRIWIHRREPEQMAKGAQVLSYMDFRPSSSKRPNGSTTSYEDADDEDDNENNRSAENFENLEDVIRHVNCAIRSGLIEGHMLGVETLLCEANLHWNTHPEMTVLSIEERGVSGLRIYFVKTDSQACEDEIGIADFVPRVKGRGSFIRKPTFDHMEEVVYRAAHWLSMHPENQFLSAQSVDIKLTHRTKADTLKLADTKTGDHIRVLRIAYRKSSDVNGQEPQTPTCCICFNEDAPECSEDAPVDDSQRPSDFTHSVSSEDAPPPGPHYLASKLFAPLKDTDTMADLEGRIRDFLEELDCRDLRVLGAETTYGYVKSFHSPEQVEATFEQTFQGSRFGGVYMLIGVRLYYDEGYYNFKHRQDAKSEETIHYSNKKRNN